MLTQEENDYLCRVGPGTPMGNLMREYWLPAARSDELPEPNGAPLRVKLLGEELIGYRMGSGKIGLVQNNCPHRGASLFYGRNEEEGLRCVYHGWKFDGTGQCVDMPSEPPESNFMSKIKAVSYPTHERGGIIWAYMGPREVPPPLPDIEANIVNTDPEQISILHRECNWMQGIEGELDTVHFAFLHAGHERLEDQEPKSFMWYHMRNRRADFEAIDTEFGCSYGARRPAEADSYYWRIGHVMFPFFALQAAGDLGPVAKMNAYVPMDDEHTLEWEISVRTDGQPSRNMSSPINRTSQPLKSARGGTYLPQTTDWFGRFNLDQKDYNDYGIDREAQSKMESYTGIPGIRQQDMAMTESMGPVYKRWQEHLGTTDAMIIRARNRWIRAAKEFAERGVTPPGVDQPWLYRQRSGECILPRDVSFWDGSRELREIWSAPEPDHSQEPVAGG